MHFSSNPPISMNTPSLWEVWHITLPTTAAIRPFNQVVALGFPKLLLKTTPFDLPLQFVNYR